MEDNAAQDGSNNTHLLTVREGRHERETRVEDDEWTYYTVAVLK